MQVLEQQVTEQPICVIVEGECNHADVTVEEVDFGRTVYRDGEFDHEDDWQQVLQCTKCKAFRQSVDEDWHGVTVLPMPHIFNNGELIHDVR